MASLAETGADQPLADCVEIGDSVLYQAVGDDVVLLNLTNQDYFGLDSVGAEVWRLLLVHQNIAIVAKHISEIYAVDEQTALKDIEPLISDLLSARLLRRKVSLDV